MMAKDCCKRLIEDENAEQCYYQDFVHTCAGVAGEDVVKGWDLGLDSSATVDINEEVECKKRMAV